jgi:hypothetical protein
MLLDDLSLEPNAKQGDVLSYDAEGINIFELFFKFQTETGHRHV